MTRALRTRSANGSPKMGAYKYVLSGADLNDLVSWLHDENCCWNSDAPPLNPRYKAAAAAPAQSLYGALTGGPKGFVKNAHGEPIEGIMVQLISDQSAIRTTVFSHTDGHYEFPKVAPGTYTLRIAKPLEFYPWSKEKVEIKGDDTLDDITLLRVTQGEFLPPFPDDRGAVDRIGMAREPAGDRGRQEDAHRLLQFLPRISADFSQPLR